MNGLYIGTYTKGRASCGIYRTALGAQGRFAAPELAAATDDPSYVIISGDGGRMFCVNEHAGGASSFALMRQGIGEAVLTGRAATLGDSPCHLALSPDGRELAVANYGDGVVSICRVENGALTGEVQALPGRAGAHAHMCVFDEDRLLVCDLGCDMVRAFSRAGGAWREDEPLFTLPEGAGPRHMVLGGRAIYVLGELDSRLHVFMRGQGAGYRYAGAVPLAEQERMGSLAQGERISGGGAIRLSRDGRHLLCTTRHDSRICLLSVSDDGMPRFEASLDCGGRNPRDAEFVGGYIVCACQDEGGLVCLHPEGEGARVTDRCLIDAPVCVLNADA